MKERTRRAQKKEKEEEAKTKKIYSYKYLCEQYTGKHSGIHAHAHNAFSKFNWKQCMNMNVIEGGFD